MKCSTTGCFMRSYYYADEAEGTQAERYIGCTVWTPPTEGAVGGKL
jgi:hypothetical protein